MIDPSSVFPGSRNVSGSSSPDCPGCAAGCDGLIHVYDCGPETPPVCHDGNDVQIASCSKTNGFYNCLLAAPLQPGHIIYDTDGCFDPALFGPSPPVLVPTPAAVPLLSPWMIVALTGTLLMVALMRLRRLRRSGPRR